MAAATAVQAVSARAALSVCADPLVVLRAFHSKFDLFESVNDLSHSKFAYRYDLRMHFYSEFAVKSSINGFEDAYRGVKNSKFANLKGLFRGCDSKFDVVEILNGFCYSEFAAIRQDDRVVNSDFADTDRHGRLSLMHAITPFTTLPK